MITLIAAMSRGRVMGANGKLPWGRTMKTDQARYKKMTQGKTVVIGNSTYDPDDEYLHHTRHTYVLSRKAIPAPDNVSIINGLEPIIEAAKDDEVLVLGGANVFEQFIPIADKLELTYIDADYKGDRYFPAFNESEWRIVKEEAHSADENNKHNYRFVTLMKK